MGTYFLGIEIDITMTSREDNVKNKAIHFFIPSPRRLLKAIKIFLKVANTIRVIMNIARNLVHANFFLQIPMQKSGFKIHLMDLPFM
jgi:hypothetical protein